MGNTHVKPHPRTRNKKQVHWKAAARPFPPGKPSLITEVEATPDLVSIRWSKPINDGGSPISGYLVEHRRVGSPHWVRATPLLVPLPELTISGLEPGWRYQFRVSAQNAVGISDPSELSEPITVTLQRSAVTAPRFTQELEDTVALENEKVEFVVHYLGQPAPKVCWYKDEFEIFSSRRIRILTENDRSVLTVHQTSLSDEGEIKCAATNRAGHVTTKAKLTVEAPPSIRLPRQYEEGLLFEIGEMIRLKVSVAGRPTPLVFWSHNGESIKNNDRYELEYIDKSSILKVNEAQRNDRGEYQIKAVNKLGEDTQSFLVTVTDKPSPPGKARVLMALGRSVTLSWSAPRDDGGCKIGNYIIEYYRLGWNVWLKAATSRQLTTILGDLIEGSEYKFRIKAESPYGVSDPSDETEVIFVPDPKRGMLEPQVRGRSQPKDVQEIDTPVAVRRKNKPRSQSSSRAEDQYKESYINSNIQNAGIPKRPDRNKIKSPPKTPEMSPISLRKEIDTKMNKAIFERSDRSSVARELAYGSPEIKVKKDAEQPSQYINNYYSSSSEKSRTPSPSMEKPPNHKVYTVKIDSSQLPVTEKQTRSPSPEVQRNKSPRENNENFTGSSEFMLVLYPDENERGHSDFDFDENSIPPPMSLSAPELGMEPPVFNNLKTSASSTELLHERAMMRFQQAAEAEEAELEKRRKIAETKNKIVADIPKILINSKDDQHIVGLDRQQSFRRRMSSGGISHQQALWAQRRHSLKNPSELTSDVNASKLHKFAITPDLKREMMMNKQRSESEEREEEAFENVRKRMALQGQSSFEKRKIAVVDEDKWGDDYISSTDSENESEMSEDERSFTESIYKNPSFYDNDDEENDTYHPGSVKSAPFEILTKRKDLPDPNFVPKPILKKKETDEQINQEPTISHEIKPRIRSHSPMPSQHLIQRERSQSLTEGGPDIGSIKSAPSQIPVKSRSRAFSLLPQKELLSKKVDIPENLISRKSTPVSPQHNISAVAHISGITAASIVIPGKLLEKQKEAEEAKVVIEHYGDIIKNLGKRKHSYSRIYMDRDSLKQVAENIETPQTDLEENNALESPKFETPTGVENKDNFNNSSKSSFTDHYDTQSRRDSLKTNQQIALRDNYVGQPRRDSLETRQQFALQEQYNNQPRMDSLQNNQNIATQLRRDSLKTEKYSNPPRKDSISSGQQIVLQDRFENQPRRDSLRTEQQISLLDHYDSPPRRESLKVEKSTALLDHYNQPRRDSLTIDQEVASRDRKVSPQRKRERTLSRSPTREINNTGATFRSKTLPSRNKPQTFKSPIRAENWSNLKAGAEKPVRKTSPSPMRTGGRRKTSPSPMRKEMTRKTSPSPLRKTSTNLESMLAPTSKHRPMLREIMTQTSIGLETYDSSDSRTSSPIERLQRQEELIAHAEVKVRSLIDYITDLTMFIVACWLYLFKNELYAIPVLLIMVYRQLQQEISKRIPKWILRRLKRKNKKK